MGDWICIMPPPELYEGSFLLTEIEISEILPKKYKTFLSQPDCDFFLFPDNLCPLNGERYESNGALKGNSCYEI